MYPSGAADADRDAERIVSGEGVALALPHSGVGSRLVAALIDFAVQGVLAVVLLVITVNLGAGGDAAGLAALIVTELVLVIAGYPILWEWLTRGRTLGKLCLGLRVVRDDGGPIGFRHALVRGLAGLVLEKPGLASPVSTALGVLTMIFSRRAKRLGDMMAGTFVLNERAGTRAATIAAPSFGVPVPLQGWASALDLNRLDDGLALAIRQFLMRSLQMTPEAQHQLAESLRARVAAVTAPPPPPGTPTFWMLSAVLGERRRRADAAAAAQLARQSPYPQSPFPQSPFPQSPFPQSPFPQSPFPQSPYVQSPAMPPPAASPPSDGFAPPG